MDQTSAPLAKRKNIALYYIPPRHQVLELKAAAKATFMQSTGHF